MYLRQCNNQFIIYFMVVSTSLNHQLPLSFDDEESPAADSGFENMSPQERTLAKAISKNAEGIRRLLSSAMIGGVTHHLNDMALTQFRNSLDIWIAEGRFLQIAETLEQMGVHANTSLPQRSFLWITIVSIHHAYEPFLKEMPTHDNTSFGTVPMSDGNPTPTRLGEITTRLRETFDLLIAVNGQKGANADAIKSLLAHGMTPAEIKARISRLSERDFPPENKAIAYALVESMSCQARV